MTKKVEEEPVEVPQEPIPQKVFVFPVGYKVATIELDELRLSGIIKKAGTNNPGKTRPVQSWQFIDQLIALLASQNVLPDPAGGDSIPLQIDKLYVERRFSSRILTSEEEKIYDENNTPIEHWVFNHVVGKLIIGDQSGEQGPAIAFSFNKNGIALAYGAHVTACSNLCIFGEYHMQTYGDERLPYSKMMTILEYWLSNMKPIYEKNLEKITVMKEGRMDEHSFFYYIGALYVDAIRRAYKETSFHACLNTTQLSVLVQNYLDMKSEFMEKSPEEVFIISVWEFYNLGTAVLKSENVGAEDILQVNRAWTDYVLTEVRSI